MKIVIIEDEKAAVRNLTSLLNEIKPNGEIVFYVFLTDGF